MPIIQTSDLLSLKSKVLPFIYLLLLLVMVYWFFEYKVDFKYEKVDKGYQGEALTNPFLAAEYFLRRMGQNTKKITLFTEKKLALSENDSLLIPGSRIAYDQRRSQMLLDWVGKGGHLIITGEARKGETYGSRDNLLNKIGLKIDWKVLEANSLNEDAPVDLDIEDEDDFWRIDFVDYQIITYDSDFNHEVVWSVTSNTKLHALQMKFGQGLVTLLSDTKMFRNEFIDDYDHAAFLFSLSNDQAQVSNDSVFYYSLSEDQLSLISWLWLKANPLMVSMFILTTVVLWMMMLRFGPIINVHEPVRKRFLDHIIAAGNYHWRQGHYNRLINNVRKQLSEKIQRSYPEWRNISREQQLKHLVDKSHLDIQVIEKAIFDTNIEQIEDFVTKIKVLEKLRKSL